jgi:hypothetical protein
MLRGEASSCAVRIISTLTSHTISDTERQYLVANRDKYSHVPKIDKFIDKFIYAKQSVRAPYDICLSSDPALGPSSHLDVTSGILAVTMDAIVSVDSLNWSFSSRPPSHHYVGYFTEKQFPSEESFLLWSNTLRGLGWIVMTLGESRHCRYNIGMVSVAIKAPESVSRWNQSHNQAQSGEKHADPR